MRSHLISQHRTGIVVLLVLTIGILTLSGAPQATAQSTGESGATVSSINHEQTVVPDSSFDITVETTDSAGTTVAVKPEEFDVSLSSESGTIDDNEVQFLDVSGSDSTYRINVNVIGGKAGDTAEIAAWVNAGDRADADDIATSTIEIRTPEEDTSESDEETKKDNQGSNQNNKNSSQSGKETNSTTSDKLQEDRNTSSPGTNEQQTGEPQVEHDNNSEIIENNSEPSTGNETTNAVPNDTKETETNDSTPGFGTWMAIVSLISSGYLLAQQQ